VRRDGSFAKTGGYRYVREKVALLREELSLNEKWWLFVRIGGSFMRTGGSLTRTGGSV
jgi:hypothetical protein